MKSALIKELYHIKEYRLPSFVAYAVIAAAGMLHWIPTAVTFVMLCIALASITHRFTADDSSGWLQYSKVLPCSAAKAVAARYIMIFAELVTVCLVIFGVLSFSHSVHSAVSSEATRGWLLLSNFSLSCIALSVVSVINYASQSQTAQVVSKVFVALVIVICAEINLLRTGSLFNGLSAVMYLEKWVVALILLVDLLIVAVSFLLSVCAWGKNRRSSRKSLKRAVALISCVVVAVSGSAIAVLESKEMLVSSGNVYTVLNESNFYIMEKYDAYMRPATYGVINNSEKICQAKMKELTQCISGRTFCDKPVEETESFFRKLDMKKQKTKFDFLDLYCNSLCVMRDDFGKVEINVYTDDETEPSNYKVFTITAPVGYTYIKTSTYSDVIAVANSMYGLTEEQLLERFEECRLNVRLIEEYYNALAGCVERKYEAGYYIETYNGVADELGKTVTVYISAFVRNGKVCETILK